MQSKIDQLQEEKERLVNSLVESEYVCWNVLLLYI